MRCCWVAVYTHIDAILSSPVSTTLAINSGVVVTADKFSLAAKNNHRCHGIDINPTQGLITCVIDTGD